MPRTLSVFLLALISLSGLACTQQNFVETNISTSKLSMVIDGPVELGRVRWNRDLDAAKKLAQETGKPIFIQFQEVPG